MVVLVPIRTMGSCRVWSSAMVLVLVVLLLLGILRIRGSIIMVLHRYRPMVVMGVMAMEVMEVMVVRTMVVVQEEVECPCRPHMVPHLPCTVLRTVLVHLVLVIMVRMVLVLVECMAHNNKVVVLVEPIQVVEEVMVVEIIPVVGVVLGTIMVVVVEMVVLVIMHMVVVLLLQVVAVGMEEEEEVAVEVVHQGVVVVPGRVTVPIRMGIVRIKGLFEHLLN
mmetsp:Transcript_27376/g.40431  ORF Transcript_27376/g.40431 Transcript_27376/m.40431 type:complete len:221 (+) Transcript_27376:792-1454(+)